jgi:hypothetical protein
VPDLFSPVDYAIPVFIALILIELVWAKRHRPESYEPRDTLTSLALGTGSTVAGALFGGFVAVLAMWLYDHRLLEIGWVWWAWPLCFVLDDFAYYWAHRTGHRVRWFWAAHVNHHSSQHYNLSTALRQSWTGFFALGFIFRIPLAFIGFHPAMILFVGAINLIYQFWIHTEAIGRLPRWFEAVLNTRRTRVIWTRIMPGRSSSGTVCSAPLLKRWRVSRSAMASSNSSAVSTYYGRPFTNGSAWAATFGGRPGGINSPISGALQGGAMMTAAIPVTASVRAGWRGSNRWSKAQPPAVAATHHCALPSRLMTFM